DRSIRAADGVRKIALRPCRVRPPRGAILRTLRRFRPAHTVSLGGGWIRARLALRPPSSVLRLLRRLDASSPDRPALRFHPRKDPRKVGEIRVRVNSSLLLTDSAMMLFGSIKIASL